jgi:hypothetical protein
MTQVNLSWRIGLYFFLLFLRIYLIIFEQFQLHFVSDQQELSTKKDFFQDEIALHKKDTFSL